MIPFGKRPKKLPAVLGVTEVDRLLQCVRSIKHRTFLLTLYAAGLRLSEAAWLTIPDIDSERMLLRVAHSNRREIYDLLFRRAWRALREVIEEEQ